MAIAQDRQDDPEFANACINFIQFTLETFAEKLAHVPLLYDPGTRWSYSMATDVCGYLVQVISGQPFEQFLQERLFEPFFTTSSQGSGLGLYLCRELCDSNGAILNYDRTDHGETRFRVSVPINSQAS